MRRALSFAVSIVTFITLAAPGASGAADDAAIEEMVRVLAERGLIDEEESARILYKHDREQVHQLDVAAGEAGAGLQWYGDFRGRYEAFFFDSDSIGNSRDNRYRLRYRARIGFQKQVTENIAVGLRVISGGADPRGQNQSLGDGGNLDNAGFGEQDFGSDPLSLDLAWASFTLPRTQSGIENTLVVGKIDNPYRWNKGLDAVVFDSDLSLEGAALETQWELSESAWLFANTGAFVVEERSTEADPKLIALQIGGGQKLGGGIEVGFRVSGYEWRSLDPSFIMRAMALGNLSSAFDSRARIGDIATYAKLEAAGQPLLLWATLTRNFTADSAVIGGFDLDEESDAVSLGFEIGDPTVLQLGGGFFQVEANAVPANFTDSDTFDGRTNGRGFIVYAQRKLESGVTIKVKLIDSDSLRNSGGASGPFAASSANADRKRLQTDFSFRF